MKHAVLILHCRVCYVHLQEQLTLLRRKIVLGTLGHAGAGRVSA